MCVNAQFSKTNGLSKSIFIDTEGSFVTKRVVEIAEETIKEKFDSRKMC
jgi:hypothetical protein